MANFLSDLQKKYSELLSPVQQGISQVGKAINSNPVTKTIANTAVRSVAPMLANNNSFVNTFSQAPKVDLTSNIKNPYLKFGASIPESIVNSPRNTAQGMQGLNQQASDMYLRGQMPRPQTLLSNVGKSLDLPLNLMGGSLLKSTAKGVAEQGFKQLGKQGLFNAMKEGAWEGGKIGTAFGLSGGLQSGENINDPFEYAKNLGMSTLEGGVGGAVVGGLGAGGMYGFNKGANAFNKSVNEQTSKAFKEKLVNLYPHPEKIPYVASIKRGLDVTDTQAKGITDAVVQFKKGNIGDSFANNLIQRATEAHLPQYKNKTTIEQAHIWDNILDLKDGNIPQNIHPEIQKIIGNVQRDIKSRGFAKFDAFVGDASSKSNTQTKQKTQTPTVEEFVNQSTELSVKNPSAKNIPSTRVKTQAQIKSEVKGLEEAKQALLKVYTLSDADKKVIRNVTKVDELTPYFKKLGPGSTAKFFNEFNPQAQIKKEVGEGYDIASEPRVQGQMRGLTEKGRQMTIDAEKSRRPIINEPDLPYILKRAGAAPEEVATGKITVYRATENGKILPGDFVTPDKSVLKPYFDQRLETGRKPKIVSQQVNIRDLVIGDEVTDFVYRPQSPQKSFTQKGSYTNTRAEVGTKNVAQQPLSDIRKLNPSYEKEFLNRLHQTEAKLGRKVDPTSSRMLYDQLLKQQNESYLYHGTTPEAIQSIKALGFKPIKGNNEVYFATHPDVTKQYGKSVIKLAENNFDLLDSSSERAKNLRMQAGLDPNDKQAVNQTFRELVKNLGWDGYKYKTDRLNADVEIYNTEKLNNVVKQSFRNTEIQPIGIKSGRKVPINLSDANPLGLPPEANPKLDSFSKGLPGTRVSGNSTPIITPNITPNSNLSFEHSPIIPQSSPQQPTANLSQTKKYTQLGSATNTRADQIAGKFRNVNNFEAEMDAQIGKTFEKPFSGKSRVKAKQPVDLPGDQASTDFATGRMAMGDGGGIKGLPKDTSDQFQLWVNRRRATDIEGFLKKKEFKDLDNKGVNGIFEFQSGNKSGRFSDVKRYFDAKYKTLQDNKIEFDYRQDYLPQLWNNSQDEINQVFGRRLGTKPSFTLEALFKSYEEGMNAGLKPKFGNISDLVGWYEQKANKALADKRFFDYLGHDGQILPSGKAPQEWVTLDPDRFPKFLSQIGDEQFAGTYKAPKELADVINNYLQGARFPFLEKVAGYVSKVKNITLNFGIPGTGINMHGVNILARHTLMGTGGNPISRFITGGKFMLAPNLAAKELDKSMVNAPQAVKNGLSLSAEDYSGLMKQGEGFRAQFGRKWEAMFGDPLFNKMIPALKLSSYENLVKNGMNEKDAAKLINNVYGGINWEQMGRSKDMQNLIRIAILAPDWAESTLKIGGNFAKALNPLERSETVGRYRTMMATVFASYIAHNIVNKITSGHYSYENDPSNIFNIEIGYTDSGEKRYFRPYGTGLDMVRLPAEVAMGLYKGDLTGITRLLRNRLSIPAGVGLGLLTDQDYRGNAIGYRGTDKYGNEMPLSQRAGNITSEMASLVGVPAFTRQLYRGVSGQQGLEESLTQGLELPFRYSNTGNSNVQKQVDFIADEQGLKGKDRYDFNQQLKGQSKFSDNQLNVIKSYDDKSQGLKDTLQLRKVRSEVEKAKKGALKESGIDQADAAEETPITTNSNMQLEIAKSRVKMTKKTERVGDNIVYPTETGSSTLSLTPPTKGSGIGAYANKDWNITKAREVWNNDQLSKEDKDYAFKKLNVKAEDVRYDALANYSNDIKSQYLSSKSDTKEKLINNILTGRKRSIGDNIFASDGVIDSLVDEGKLTKEEGKALKAIDYNKDGSRKIKVGSGRGKKIKIPKVKAITIKFNKRKRIKVRQIKPKKVKQYKLSKVTKVKKLKV